MTDWPDSALAAAERAIIEAASDFGQDDTVAGSSREFARAALEAAAPILAGNRMDELRAALNSISARITTSAADFGTYKPDSWVYGIAVGWDCEEGHDHDDICGGTGAMTELTARHGWDEAAVARLRSYRKAYAAAVAGEDGGS